MERLFIAAVVVVAVIFVFNSLFGTPAQAAGTSTSAAPGPGNHVPGVGAKQRPV